jgi:aspartate/methionine/tyrosine aminotransferase
VEFAGAKLKTAPLNCENGKWKYDFDAFERAITPQTKVVIITNPHNPTGKIFELEEL